MVKSVFSKNNKNQKQSKKQQHDPKIKQHEHQRREVRARDLEADKPNRAARKQEAKEARTIAKSNRIIDGKGSKKKKGKRNMKEGKGRRKEEEERQKTQKRVLKKGVLGENRENSEIASKWLSWSLETQPKTKPTTHKT